MLVECSDGFRINARHISTMAKIYHNQATNTYGIKVTMSNGEKHELKFANEADANTAHMSIVRDNQMP